MSERSTPPTTQAAPVAVVADGMHIDWDVPITMDDGLQLRADVFRPVDDTPVPVLVTYGPYGKGKRFSEHHPEQWQRLVDKRPEVLDGSSNKYQAWETPDPERWVPHGYAYVRVDSRGAGRSPGFLAPHSSRETRDAAQCVQWAGAQPWSTGKVGMLGISYYACISWRVAALSGRPTHLAAVCPWEGNADPYRDASRHGGILTTWSTNWWTSRILPLQHGIGERGERSPNTGDLVAGPETLTDDELRANRVTWDPAGNPHVLADPWWRSREVAWDNVTVPILSSGNWGGAGMHLRGNTEAYLRAATPDKWLEIHGEEHWTEFYSEYGLDIQRRFFDRFLKSSDTSWADQPRVVVNVRRPDGSCTPRGESDWPLPGTDWTRAYLDATGRRLAPTPPTTTGSCTFAALGDGVRFMADAADEEREITGPIAVRLHISSSTTDADLFVVVHLFDPAGEEVTFQGAMDPHSSVGKGWLRASHRKLDPKLSRNFRPYHSHDEQQPLEPGTIYPVDIEVWPTSVVLPPGYRIGLSVLGRDYVNPSRDSAAVYESFGQQIDSYGSGTILHDDAADRPLDVFGGSTTVHTGPDTLSYALFPVIPLQRVQLASSTERSRPTT